MGFFDPLAKIFRNIKEYYIGSKHTSHILYTFSFLLSGLCLIAYLLFKYDVDSDVANSYSYLAQEFSHNNWDHFFNPNLPLLMPFISGILTLSLKIASWRACELVSGIFYICTLFPLYKLLKYLIKSSLFASLGCLLYICAPQLMRFSCGGWLESGRTFFIILIIYLTTKYAGRFKTSTLMLLGAAFGCLCLVRGEGIFFAILLWIYCAYLTFARCKSARFMNVFRTSAIIFTMTLLFLIPRSFITYYHSGYFVPDQRIVGVIRKISNNNSYLEVNANIPSDFFTFSTSSVIIDFISGSELGYLILAVFGISLLLWQKRWKKEYNILLILPLLNFLGCLNTASSHRYFTLNVPLLMIFVLNGIILAYKLIGIIISRKYTRYIFIFVLILVMALELDPVRKVF